MKWQDDSLDLRVSIVLNNSLALASTCGITTTYSGSDEIPFSKKIWPRKFAVVLKNISAFLFGYFLCSAMAIPLPSAIKKEWSSCIEELTE